MICKLKVIHYCQLMSWRDFRNFCLKIYETDPAKFFSMTSSFKKDNSKIRSLKCYQYVLNGRKRYQRLYYQYAKANNIYMKDYD